MTIREDLQPLCVPAALSIATRFLRSQCVASWRGAFSTPLGCSSCPLLWCSRCLTNIFGVSGEEEGFSIEAVIRATNAKGTWQCFKCTGTCACQAPELKRLPVIDRHKKWGWVGVTGVCGGSSQQRVAGRQAGRQAGRHTARVYHAL